MASRARLTCLFWREGPQLERIALLLQRQMATVGIDLELEPLSIPDLMRRVRQGNFDTYLMMMGSGRTFHRTYRFWHSAPPGAAEYQDTGYAGADAILERLRVARSEADVRVAVADLRQRFYEDAPAAFLAWPQTTRAVDARFHLAAPDDPDIFANVWAWRPASVLRAAR
jgi:ABC-type transport system substrate-binding protein